MIAQAAQPIGLVLSDEERDLIIAALTIELDRRHRLAEDWGAFNRRKGVVRDLIALLRTAA